ncbi:MAG: phycoerythrobilin:ferredoxin oxidoreductase [Candidatus Odinarchaeota archaeon]
MLIQDTIFYRQDWRWHNFLKYLTNNLSKYNCLEKILPSEYSYKDSTYGSKKSKKNVNLSTWGVTHKKRIKFARAVCINSPNYSVLNFLIIPNTIYNVPFFGVDFVSLPNSYLLVLDFQPSLKIQNQYNNQLLEKLIKLEDKEINNEKLKAILNLIINRFEKQMEFQASDNSYTIDINYSFSIGKSYIPLVEEGVFIIYFHFH